MSNNRNELGTLKDFSQGVSKEDIILRNKLLITQHQLSAIQIELNHKIERILDKQGKFKHEIKHNHKQVQSLLEKNMKPLFKDELPDGKDAQQRYFDEMEMYNQEYEALLDAILKCKGITEDVEVAV